MAGLWLGVFEWERALLGQPAGLPHGHGRVAYSWACSCLFALAAPSLRLRATSCWTFISKMSVSHALSGPKLPAEGHLPAVHRTADAGSVTHGTRAQWMVRQDAEGLLALASRGDRHTLSGWRNRQTR